MPIDASIPLGIRPVQVESPMNQLAAVLGIQQAQQANQMNQLKFDEYARERARQNKLLESMQGLDPNATDDERINVLNRLGFFDQADKMRTQATNRAKAAADTQNAQAAALGKVTDIRRGLAQQVFANPSREYAMHAIDAMEAVGKNLNVDLSKMLAGERAFVSQLQTPEDIKRWAAGHAIEKASELLPKTTTTNLGGVTRTTAIDPVTAAMRVVDEAKNTQSPDNAATVAATIRGQNLTDARAREQLAQGGNQYDAERGVIVNTRTGLARPAATMDGKPLGAKDKPLTDAQAKANLFGTRMKESDKILSDLESKYMPGAVNAKMAAGELPIVGGLAGYAGNSMLSNQGQMAEQAMRDFINAVLRRESGAVISPSEFANANKQYFPQPGDGKDVLEQKRKNRALAINGLEVEVPGGFRRTPTLNSPSGTPSVSPDVEALLKKYGG